MKVLYVRRVSCLFHQGTRLESHAVIATKNLLITFTTLVGSVSFMTRCSNARHSCIGETRATVDGAEFDHRII